MNRIKLIAADLDDTLLDPGLNITPRVKEAVKGALERKVSVVIATGRMFCAALPFARELSLETPLITYQGALVKDRAGRVYFYQPVPLELAQDVITHLAPTGFHIQAYVDDTLCMPRLSPEGERYARLSGVIPRIVGDLLRYLNVPPTKVLMVAPEEEIDKLLPGLLKRYAGRLHVSKSKPHFLEFSHPEATKGEALKRLATAFDLKREEIMAVGDSYNDIPMLDFAGTAVVVGNAREEIKSHATYVTAPNSEDGVAAAIEKLVLGKVEDRR
ncbi:MAG: Cof-type HAD-IIB family hydrolase [Bacillota bacterium]